MMENLTGSAVPRVYLAHGPTDMRKSIDGLAAMVQVSFQLDPFAPAVRAEHNLYQRFLRHKTCSVAVGSDTDTVTVKCIALTSFRRLPKGIPSFAL